MCRASELGACPETGYHSSKGSALTGREGAKRREWIEPGHSVGGLGPGV